jgi:hypothetical protein
MLQCIHTLLIRFVIVNKSRLLFKHSTRKVTQSKNADHIVFLIIFLNIIFFKYNTALNYSLIKKPATNQELCTGKAIFLISMDCQEIWGSPCCLFHIVTKKILGRNFLLLLCVWVNLQEETLSSSKVFFLMS